MPFVTHTEGGSWTGGGTEVPNCDLAERNAITAGFGMKDSRGVPCLDALGGFGALTGCLRGKTVASVDIDCRAASCDGAFGRAPINGNSILLCAPALPPGGLQADCDVTVFHEVVHSCGGLEVDAWALENQCYVGRGTFTPGSSTVSGFVAETTDIGGGLRAGRFVVWRRSTGQVFVRVETGGSWNSGPTVSAGARLANVSWPVV